MDNVFKKFFSNGEDVGNGFGSHFGFGSNVLDISNINPIRRNKGHSQDFPMTEVFNKYIIKVLITFRLI
jgi:hypothetical protein